MKNKTLKELSMIIIVFVVMCIYSSVSGEPSCTRVIFLSKELNAKLGLETVPFTKEDKKEIKRFLFSQTPLDHIFYSSNELELKKDSPDVLETIKSSDHKPLFVEFKVRDGN